MKSTKTTHLRELGFERWSELARDDPDLFERLHLEAIEDVIINASPENRPRLRCLQWRIEQERRRAASPMDACIRISRMMWDSVNGRGGLIERLQQPMGGSSRPESRSYPLPDAIVIPFRSRGA